MCNIKEKYDRPSILFVVTNSALNRGMNTGLENLAWGLAEKNFKVHILCGGSKPYSHDYTFSNNVMYHFIEESGDNPRNFLKYILDIVNENKIDVIIGWILNIASLTKLIDKYNKNVLFIANQGQMAPRCLILSLIKRALKGMMSLTDALILYNDILNSRNHFHQIVSISKAVQRSCIKAYSLKSEKCKVIYRGIDINKYTYVEKKYSKKNIQILYSGNIHPSKGIDDLIKSLNYITEPIEIVLCGKANENYISTLKAKIKNLSTSHNITYAGTQSSENLINFYHNCDIFVFLSHSEGLGKALLEAMSCGCPVITSNIDVFKEIIKNEYNGLIAKVKDPKDIAKQIIRFINNPSLRAKCGYNARKTIEKKFSKELEIQRWCNLLDDLYTRNRVTL